MTGACAICGEPTQVKMRTHRRRTVLRWFYTQRVTSWQWACMTHVKQVALQQACA